MSIDLGRYVNRNKRKPERLLWELCHLVFCRLTPRWCLNGWRCLWLRIFGAKVAQRVRLQGSARIWQPWRVQIGANSWIDGGANLYSVDDITIGSNAVISADAFLCTAGHDISSPVFALKTAPIVIGDCAWIGAKAIVLPGVSVGEGAVVGAGAVVTKDVEPWTVVGGNPAIVIGKRTVRTC